MLGYARTQSVVDLDFMGRRTLDTGTTTNWHCENPGATLEEFSVGSAFQRTKLSL